MIRRRFLLLVVSTSLLGSSFVSAAPAPDTQPQVQISAQVDRTTVDVGEQLTLTIAIEGDVQRVELEPFEFPAAFRVAAQSRSTNLSMEFGKIRRSVSLIYALVALEPGTFQLGPFTVIHRGQSHLTEPLEIVVKKPAVPPALKPGERFVL